VVSIVRLALSSGLRSMIGLDLDNSGIFFAKSSDRAMMRRFRADERCYGLLRGVLLASTGLYGLLLGFPFIS